MEPAFDKKSHHCKPECPFLEKWEHPFFHHTGWCWKQMKDLSWYDYWIADCIDGNPDKTLVSIRHAGRTKAP